MITLPQAPELRNAQIEVIGVTLLAGAGPLRAWASLPQCEYLYTGQKNYAPVVELSESLKREVSQAVLAAWERRASDAR